MDKNIMYYYLYLSKVFLRKELVVFLLNFQGIWPLTSIAENHILAQNKLIPFGCTGRWSCGKQWLEIILLLLLFLPRFFIFFPMIFVKHIYCTKYTIFEKFSKDTHDHIQTRMPNSSPWSSSNFFQLVGTHSTGTTGTLLVPAYCGVRLGAGLGMRQRWREISEPEGWWARGGRDTLCPPIRSVPVLTTTALV